MSGIIALTNRVFIGGNFTSVNRQRKYYLAALDPSSGSMLPFDAGMGFRGGTAVPQVTSLVKAGEYIYAGGFFTNSFGTTQARLAAFHAQTFGFKDDFRPLISTNRTLNSFQLFTPGVTSLAAQSNTLFVAGMFVGINGQPRTNAAALDLPTGELTEWAPQPSGFASGESLIRSMSIVGDRMFICGPFSALGGRPRLYNAVVDLEKGRMLDWPQIAGMGRTDRPRTIHATPQFAFVNTFFGDSANTIRVRDTVSGGELGWRFDMNQELRTLDVINNSLIVGGRFGGAGSGSISSRGFAVFPLYPKWGNPTAAPVFRAPIEGRLTEQFSIEASTNLVDWVPILTTNSAPAFVDEEFKSHRQRFFRIRALLE